MPTRASNDNAMIWTTAKSTEVNRRRTARPIRSKKSGVGGRAVSAHVVTGLAIGWSSERSDGGRFGRRRRLGAPERRGVRFRGRGRVGCACSPCRLQGAREVGDEIVEILEADRAAEQACGDAGRRKGVVVELSMGGRRRMAHDREDAAE